MKERGARPVRSESLWIPATGALRVSRVNVFDPWNQLFVIREFMWFQLVNTTLLFRNRHFYVKYPPGPDDQLTIRVLYGAPHSTNWVCKSWMKYVGCAHRKSVIDSTCLPSRPFHHFAVTPARNFSNPALNSAAFSSCGT